VEKFALLIGVSESSEEDLPKLPSAIADIRAMQAVLQNPEMGGFKSVAVLPNPTRQQMEEAIEALFANRKTEDLVLFYFSGHGITDEKGKLYLVTPQTRKDRGELIKATAVAATVLHDYMVNSRSKHQVLILDSCFSGAIAEGLTGKSAASKADIQRELGGEGRAILTSSNAVQKSFHIQGYDLSIYTHYLIDGIQTGAANQDGDDYISVAELHEYAKKKLEQEAPSMSPQFFPGKEGYKIRLVRSPKPKGDPGTEYRKEAERLATAAEFTIPAKRMLMAFRAELELSDAEAEAIEAEVLKPFREYQRKRQEYEETLRQCLDEEATLSSNVIKDLMNFRNHLGLKLEDVVSIGRAVLQGKNLEDYTVEVERQQQEADGNCSDSKEVDPSTEDRTTCYDLKLSEVSRKDLSECDPSKILLIAKVCDPNGGWAYTLDHIQQMGDLAHSQIFKLFKLSSIEIIINQDRCPISKGDLILLSQHERITHVVEVIDDQFNEDEAGYYFRWVQVVWISEEQDWTKLPNQDKVLGFRIQGFAGYKMYEFTLFAKCCYFSKTCWSGLDAFQQNVFRTLTDTKSLNFTENLDDISSSRFGTNYYANLQDLLIAKDWRKADAETSDRMCELMDRQNDGWLRDQDIKSFPCLELYKINRLWVKYSQGQFGFSVQREIWQNCGSPTNYSRDWEKFGETVGWKDQNRMTGWLSWYMRDRYTFTEQALKGHLPSGYRMGNSYGGGSVLKTGQRGCAMSPGIFFSRCKSCGL
jgi:uncharacterized caspase-like protein